MDALTAEAPEGEELLRRHSRLCKEDKFSEGSKDIFARQRRKVHACMQAALYVVVILILMGGLFLLGFRIGSYPNRCHELAAIGRGSTEREYYK